MKKIFLISFVIIMILLALSNFLKENVKNKYYPLLTVVVEVDYQKDLVTLKDCNGYLWQFEGIEDWCINDICNCIMDNKGTVNITDDEIIKIRYERQR